jgi:hypothetical protein
MLSAFGATTIFVRGFRELIRLNEPTQTFIERRTVPVRFDLLAVMTSTLKLVYEKRLQRHKLGLQQGKAASELPWTCSSHPLKIVVVLQGRAQANRSILVRTTSRSQELLNSYLEDQRQLRCRYCCARPDRSCHFLRLRVPESKQHEIQWSYDATGGLRISLCGLQ